MNHKLLAVLAVVIVASSSFCVALAISIHDHRIHDDHGGPNHGGPNPDSPLNFDTLYFGIEGAESLSIRTVQDSSSADSSVGKSTSVECRNSYGGKAVMMTTGNSIAAVEGGYDGYHNELQKTDDHGSTDTVLAYKSESDAKGGRNPYEIDCNIVYLEKCGSLYLMMYYLHHLSDVYHMLSLENYDFWSNDKDFAFFMMDADTGKVFRLTGLWCGSTGWRYGGTNDVIPSILYMGQYDGEEYFKVNVECNKYATTPVEGMFSELEGVVAFRSDGNTLHYRNVLVDEDSMTERCIADRNDESAWVQIEGKSKMFGYEMVLYRNGVIRYVLNDPSSFNNWQGNLTGKDHVRFTDGSTQELEGGWIELSGYLCSNVEFANTYFPVSADRYESGGDLLHLAFSDSESYLLATSNHYDGCLFREKGDGYTRIYTLNPDGTVDRLTLRSDLGFELEEDIFGTSIPLNVVYSSQEGHFYDFRVRNNGVFYGPVNWSYSFIYWGTGISIIGSKLYAIDGDVMKVFDLRTGSVTPYDLPSESVRKLNVDGNGTLYLAAGNTDNIRRIDLGDGGFQLSRTSIQLQVVSRVMCGSDGEQSF